MRWIVINSLGILCDWSGDATRPRPGDFAAIQSLSRNIMGSVFTCDMIPLVKNIVNEINRLIVSKIQFMSHKTRTGTGTQIVSALWDSYQVGLTYSHMCEQLCQARDHKLQVAVVVLRKWIIWISDDVAGCLNPPFTCYCRNCSPFAHK